MEELIAAGRQPYNDHCASCHRADGKGFPNDIPALDGSRVVRGPKSKHIGIVLHGRPGTAMPPFQSHLNDYQIAAILTYERNAWTYRTLNSITPAQVRAVRTRAAAAKEQ
jgi:cytochrome c oxidase subunit 2